MKSRKKHLLFSEAFPPDKTGRRDKLFPASNIHNLLKNITIDPNKIVYKPVSAENLEEIKNLHKEWFPINYGDEWFKRIIDPKNDWYFSIGAFYEIKINKKEYKEIIIGLALCEWLYINDYFVKHTSPKIVKEICNNINYKEEVKSYLKCDDYHCAYIMTIGVLDEFRQQHIGSSLLNQVINYALSDSLCTCVYLDVVQYNKSAIKFYEKNNFVNAATIKNYYNIKGEHYDSNVFVRIFTRKEKDLYKEKNTNIITKSLNMLIVNPFCLIIKFILFFLMFQFCREKIKSY